MENKGAYVKIADLAITDDEWEMMKSLGQRLDGRIIECYRDVQGRWRFKKDDDPVTEEMLLAAAPEIRDAMHRLHAEESKKRKYSTYENGQQ